MTNNRKTTILLTAIIGISATLFMLARGAAIGVDVQALYPAFAHLEILGGVGLAILEAFALHLMVRHWRVLPQRGVYWYTLAAVMIVLLLAIPITSTPALIAVQFEARAHEVLKWSHIGVNHLTWLWTFALASIPSLMAFGIGLAEGIAETGGDPALLVAQSLPRFGADPVAIAENTGLSLRQVESELKLYQDTFNLSLNGK